LMAPATTLLCTVFSIGNDSPHILSRILDLMYIPNRV
jgi:hypothetical protein